MDLVSSAIGGVTGTVGKVERFVEAQWTQRLVQVSVYGGLMFYLLSMTDLIKMVDKNLSALLRIKLGTEGTRALHAVVFAVFLYYGTRFIFDPLLKRMGGVMEGMNNKRPAKRVAAKRPAAKRPVAKRQPKRK
tara:strand:- start:1247 stop:1645 length:399 start_codon:yes stop_codon:yes gene_type:complete